ncbi:glycosyltransferase family 2 protein [Pseudalkalibacillus salsuginis]|uniref:glycosyltransferase family 2 protein n=1 Tax=Pseudalkalibacillus salsuginis TaxID=2910972 RepID=UPI001F42386E|nr:glycosyltransferase family 2 protein [Pseudalkalibacillus salsuginis]MCF6409152.1 glycosyltransferase family 2 protein [Pseudalkalibacillus salsuginis]
MKIRKEKPLEQDIEISIIIPTYNKYPQNLLTLYSIENQQFDLSKVEVIMIDDGSTDQTRTLISHTFPFHFKLIRSGHNIGRPAARNLGIKNAKGKILIFLDAEIIVQPDFLTIHHHYHSKHSNMVVTGVMTIRRLYSILYPDFSESQLQECRGITRALPEFKAKVDAFDKKPQKLLLLNKHHIFSEKYKRLSTITPYEKFYNRVIIANYGYELKGYKIPWQMFGTGHVSVSKGAIEQVGLFSEYPGYGWDDCEMGYRLYKNGAVFTSDERLISYHQEHPIAKTIRDESKENYFRFQETYKEVDQMIISLTFLPKPFNLHKTNQILVNYQDLCIRYPDAYKSIKQCFHGMLREIGRLKSKNEPITSLSKQKIDKNALFNEIQQLRKLRRYQSFLECFKYLGNL